MIDEPRDVEPELLQLLGLGVVKLAFVEHFVSQSALS